MSYDFVDIAIIVVCALLFAFFVHYYLCVMGIIAFSEMKLYKKPVFQSILFCGVVDLTGAFAVIWIHVDISLKLDDTYEIYLRIASALTGVLFVLHLFCIMVPTFIEVITLCKAPYYHQFTSSFYVFSYLALATAISFAVYTPLFLSSYAFEYDITQDGKMIRGLRKSSITPFRLGSALFCAAVYIFNLRLKWKLRKVVTVSNINTGGYLNCTELLLVSLFSLFFFSLESVYEIAAIFYLEDPETRKYCHKFFKIYFFVIMISNGPILSIFMKEIRDPVWNFIINLPCFYFCKRTSTAEVAPIQANQQVNENENGDPNGNQMEMK